MNKSMTDLLKNISLFVFAFFFAFLFYIHMPFILFKSNTCMYIQKNENFSELINDVTKKTRYASPVIFKLYAKFSDIDRHLEVGEYCFTPRDSMISVMRKIGRAGRELRKFTLVEGWTYREMIEHLMLSPSLGKIEMLHNQPLISKSLGLPDNKLEGQFYPDTYYYTYPDTALDILEEAHALMIKKVQAFYQESQAQSFYKNSDELLTAASIIQKESNDPVDQMFVASVLVNRMKLHMKLQMDPTVMYGLRKNILNKKDLRAESPYNTYLHTGFPPTPICMPGETALFAAAHPKDSNFLYYVSKKNGRHQFSETLAEQNQAVKKYLLNSA